MQEIDHENKVGLILFQTEFPPIDGFHISLEQPTVLRN